MMIDAGSLIYGLLTDAFIDIFIDIFGESVAVETAHAFVTAEVDVDTIDSLPTIVYAVSGPGQTANGDGYWNVFLDLNVISDTANAFEITNALYDAVHAWVGVVSEFGWVHEVTDVSIFSTVQFSAINRPMVEGRDVVQYAGSFALSLRK